MRLECMLIADPKQSTAELVAEKCERLADQIVVATTAKEMLSKARELEPDLVLLSLELPGVPPKRLVPELLQTVSGTFLMATFRELSVPEMERLQSLGVEEFLPQPIDVLQLFRAASKRFNVPFRRHDRYNVALDVFRADGVMIGKTIDISEGGLRMEAIHPIAQGESILADLALGEGDKPLRIRCSVLHVEGQAPAPVRARIQFVKLFEPEQTRLLEFLKAQKPAVVANEP